LRLRRWARPLALVILGEADRSKRENDRTHNDQCEEGIPFLHGFSCVKI